MHHANWCVLQGLVRPLRRPRIQGVGEGRLTRNSAHPPNLRGLDVQLRTHRGVVEVLSRWQGIDAIWNAIVTGALTLYTLQPWRVLVGRVEFPILVLFAVYFDLSKEFASKIRGGEVRRIMREVPTLSVDVINIDASERFHHLVSVCVALGSQVGVIFKGYSGEVALISLNLVSELLRHQHSVVENVVGSRESVESPI